MRLFIGVSMVLLAFACRAVKITERKEAREVHKAVRVAHFTDTSKAQIHRVIEYTFRDTGIVSTFYFPKGTTLNDIQKGTAEVDSMFKEEKHKRGHKKDSVILMTQKHIHKKDSTHSYVEKHTLTEQTTNKTPMGIGFSLWLWWVLAGLLIYVLRKPLLRILKIGIKFIKPF